MLSCPDPRFYRRDDFPARSLVRCSGFSRRSRWRQSSPGLKSRTNCPRWTRRRTRTLFSKKERKIERKKECQDTYICALFSFPVTKCRRGKAHARERRELNIGDPIGYPRKTRSFTSDLSARAITLHAPLVPASRCWCSRRLFSSVPLDVAFAVKPFFKHSAGTPVDADECERAVHNARFANNDAKCFRDIASSTFFLAIAGDALRRRLYFAPWRKVKIDRFFVRFDVSLLFLFFFLSQCSTKIFQN